MANLYREILVETLLEREYPQLNENNPLKKAAMAFMATCLVGHSYAQCSGDLQAAMKNPNDPKNAKILSGGGTDVDSRINRENGFGDTWKMFSKKDEIEYKKQLARDEETARQQRKSESKDFKHLFDPSVDRDGHSVSREQKTKFKTDFARFMSQNPSFKSDPSRYTPEERYSFLSKVILEQSLIRRLNVLFDRPNPYDNIKMSVQELYKLIQDPKIDGFDSFTELYKKGFPGVQFPENPHKFD